MILWGFVAHWEYLQGRGQNGPPPGVDIWADSYRGSYSGSGSGDGGRRLDFSYWEDEHSGRRLAGGGEGAYIVNELVFNPFPYAATIGIVISSMSQALQCLVVAPRLLNAIAKDHILTFLDPLAVTHRGEPKRALMATCVIGSLLVLMGELDLVAPLLSMCFLVAYAFMNFSCFALTWLNSVAWRPKGINKRRYRIWYLVTSGSGFLICVTIMYTIDHWWAITACVIAMSLYIFINWKLESKGWGSAMDGIRYQLALDSLIHLEKTQLHAVNWRPQVLILYKINLSDELKGIKKHEILNIYGQLRKGNGFCVVACVLEADQDSEEAIRKAKIEKDVIQNIMKEEGIQGFAEVVVAPSWGEGANYIIQLTGIGGLVPNTVLLDWPEEWRKRQKKAKTFVNILHTALAAEKAVLAIRGLSNMPTEIVYGTIDIWWMIHDGGFLILLSWLLVQHRIWKKCQIRVFTICEYVTADEAKEAAEALTLALRQQRLFDVDVEVILADDEMIQPFTQDLTLREEERHKFMQEVRESRGGVKFQKQEEAIPMEIDDLFRHAQEEKRMGSKLSAKRDSAGDVEEVTRGSISVTDVRGSDSKPRRRNRAESDASKAESEKADAANSLPQVAEQAGENNQAQAAEAGAASTEVRKSGLLSGMFGDQEDSPADPGEASVLVTGQQTNVNDPTAVLNSLIFNRSKRAQLVVMNLPDIRGNGDDEVYKFMDYCDTLTQGLERVMFVHSSGHEIIDMSSV